MTLLTNLKSYKDIVWLFYKYGDLNLIKNFSTDLDVDSIVKEKGDQIGKAEDLVSDLESLGPFYIKLGQILSAESDLLPKEYEEALSKLQDKTSPMTYDDVEDVIFQELGDVPKKIFKKFNKEPISAASLGQVHVAELPSGKKVAVKVQRKDIQENILEQLDAFRNISEYLEENTDLGKRYHVIEKYENLRSTLLNELDYLKEANNLKILSENLKEFEHLIVPLPVDEYTTSKVLTMDFIKAEKITDLDPIDKIKINSEELAVELFRAFLKQILVDGFFQMDPHPGNVYLTHTRKEPYLALFDLGMVSQVPVQMQGKLIQCFYAMSEGRENEVTSLLISLGSKLPEFDEYLLRSKIGTVIANYRRVNIDQMPIGKLVLKISHIAAESGLWLPIQFSMIGKTLLSLSSVLKSLDPNLNPSDVLKDEVSSLLSKRISDQLTYQSLYGSIVEGIDFLQRLPGRLNLIFDFIMQSDHQIKVNFKESENIAQNFEKIANRIAMGILLASLVIAAALMMRVETDFRVLGYPGIAMILFIIAALGSFLLILSILWNSTRSKK